VAVIFCTSRCTRYRKKKLFSSFSRYSLNSSGYSPFILIMAAASLGNSSQARRMGGENDAANLGSPMFGGSSLTCSTSCRSIMTIRCHVRTSRMKNSKRQIENEELFTMRWFRRATRSPSMWATVRANLVNVESSSLPSSRHEPALLTAGDILSIAGRCKLGS